MHRPSIIDYGSSNILLQWHEEISNNMLRLISSYDNQLNKYPPIGFIESTPAYNSILVSYDNQLTTSTKLKDQLINIPTNPEPSINSPIIHEIPVQYNEDVGMDLGYLSDALSLTKTELIEIHSSSLYDLHFVGFMPGFMYLGGLDARLHHPRRETPRIKVPKGSVAIGGSQTGIYPISCPGGWHIVGHTEMDLFSPYKDPPVPFNVGDKIQFIPI